MTGKIICEKCGAEMVPIDPTKPVGMECPKCGWGWATTYTEPKYEDETIYKIILEQGNAADLENVRVISKVIGCNFITAKAIIEGSTLVLAEGKAAQVEKHIDMLSQTSLRYRVEPDWPY